MPSELPPRWSPITAWQALAPYRELPGALVLLGATAEAAERPQLLVAHDEHHDLCAVALPWHHDTLLTIDGPTTWAALAEQTGAARLTISSSSLVEASVARWILPPTDDEIRRALIVAARLPQWPDLLRAAAWRAHRIYQA